MFTDNKGVTVIEKSHYPNQIFAWGDYIINYLAKDAFGNAAKCTFELFVMRKYPVNYTYHNFLLANLEILGYTVVVNYRFYSFT